MGVRQARDTAKRGKRSGLGLTLAPCFLLAATSPQNVALGLPRFCSVDCSDWPNLLSPQRCDGLSHHPCWRISCAYNYMKHHNALHAGLPHLREARPVVLCVQWDRGKPR